MNFRKICKQYIFFFSTNDVALVIKYQFSENTEPSKKRKLDEKRQNIHEYSQIKLPAKMFLKYIETYLSVFLDDCLR